MICKRCGNESGTKTVCKDCINKYQREWVARRRAKDPDAEREAQKRAYLRKKEKLAADPVRREKYLAKTREWYQTHKEELREGRKRIPDDDPEDDLRPYRGDGSWKVISAARSASITAHDVTRLTRAGRGYTIQGKEQPC